MAADCSEDLSDDSNENVDNSEHCHVCLFPRIENFANVFFYTLILFTVVLQNMCRSLVGDESCLSYLQEYHKGVLKIFH